MSFPTIMGILNVTPDSFSDGGSWIDPGAAVAHASQMINEGADIIDVGGESTRPGHDKVGIEEELRRVQPVVCQLGKMGIPFSIDTQKAAVAQVALEHGARLVNDVSSLSDPAMVPLLLSSGAEVCLMHWSLTLPTNSTTRHIAAELLEIAGRACSAGIARERIWIDPGIGFGKSTPQNTDIIASPQHFCEPDAEGWSYPLLIGLSRKSVIGKMLGSEDHPLPVAERGAGTLAAELHVARMLENRPLIIRTHDVRALAQALVIQKALLATS